MLKAILKGFMEFAGRMEDDHNGAYAATCAYFLTMSFVPFFMIFVSVAKRMGVDITVLTEGMLSVIPSALRGFVDGILGEVYQKSILIYPISILVLAWSAAKFFHALTLGLNVISKTKETRGWLYLRGRSMLFVLIFLAGVILALYLSLVSKEIRQGLEIKFPIMLDLAAFVYQFRVLFAYFGLIILFMGAYKFLPNCDYTFRSQLPGALIVSTIWMFFSYLITLYYEYNENFNSIYGNMTSLILAMIWLYFCMYFVLIGAEINRVIYEDPEENVIVNTIDNVKDENARKQQKIQDELEAHSFDPNADKTVVDYQPADIDIPWETLEDDNYNA